MVPSSNTVWQEKVLASTKHLIKPGVHLLVGISSLKCPWKLSGYADEKVRILAKEKVPQSMLC
jgi:hypothetical protein